MEFEDPLDEVAERVSMSRKAAQSVYAGVDHSRETEDD